MTPGDHLQTAYALWLPGHQLARGAEPWLDPYSFQPEVEPRVNFAGWPFAVVYGPLQALFGTVAGWNLFVLLTYVGAGGLAALWLRALGLGLGPALVGGLAFALAPYRVAQSTGHLLGPISMLLPLALYGVERRKTWLAAAALASIPLSGQVHLALGAIPFVLVYALARRRPWLGAISAGAAVGAGVLVWALTLRDAAERPFSEVERYSATLGDFVSRDPGEFERFAYLGWLLPIAAVAGIGCLCFRNTISSGRRLALVLGLGALVPCLLALGSNLPGYGLLWRNTPLHSTRVPERMLPIACLCLAALAAVAIACVSETQARSRSRLVAAARLPRSSRPTCGCRSTTRSSPTRTTPSTRGSPTRRPGGCSSCRCWRPTTTRAASTSTTRCRRRASGRSAMRPRRRRRRSRSRASSRSAARELGVSVVVEYRDGVPRRLRSP